MFYINSNASKANNANNDDEVKGAAHAVTLSRAARWTGPEPELEHDIDKVSTEMFTKPL